MKKNILFVVISLEGCPGKPPPYVQYQADAFLAGWVIGDGGNEIEDGWATKLPGEGRRGGGRMLRCLCMAHMTWAPQDYLPSSPYVPRVPVKVCFEALNFT